MTRFASLRSRLEDLEERAHRGMTPTTDETGRRAWVKDSGLHTLYDLLRVQDRLGKGELRPEDLPERLRERVSLWSRAEVGPGDGQLRLLVKGTCLELMGRARDGSPLEIR